MQRGLHLKRTHNYRWLALVHKSSVVCSHHGDFSSVKRDGQYLSPMFSSHHPRHKSWRGTTTRGGVCVCTTTCFMQHLWIVLTRGLCRDHPPKNWTVEECAKCCPEPLASVVGYSYHTRKQWWSGSNECKISVKFCNTEQLNSSQNVKS